MNKIQMLLIDFKLYDAIKIKFLKSQFYLNFNIVGLINKFY